MKEVFQRYIPNDDEKDPKILAARKRAAVEGVAACCRMVQDLRPESYAALAEFLKSQETAEAEKKAAAIVAKFEADNSRSANEPNKVLYYAHKVVCAKPRELVGYAKEAANAVLRIGAATSKVKVEQVKAKIEGALEGVLAAALAK